MTRIDEHLLTHTTLDVMVAAAAYLVGFFVLAFGIRIGTVWALAAMTPIAAALMFASSAALLEVGRASTLASREER